MVEPGERHLVGALAAIRAARASGLTVSPSRWPAARPNTTRSIRSSSRAGWRRGPRRTPPRRPRTGRARRVSGSPSFRIDHLAMIIGRDAAHIVMHGRHHRQRLAGQVDAGEDLAGLGDPGQPLVPASWRSIWSRWRQIWSLCGPTPRPSRISIAIARLTTSRLARSLARRRVALHEALAFGIGEIAALAARALGDQHAGAVDSGRVELDELHVLQRRGRRAAPWRRRRRCRYAPRCTRNRCGRSRRWRAPPPARGSGGRCRRRGTSATTPRHSPSSMIRSIAKYSMKKSAS